MVSYDSLKKLGRHCRHDWCLVLIDENSRTKLEVWYLKAEPIHFPLETDLIYQIRVSCIERNNSTIHTETDRSSQSGEQGGSASTKWLSEQGTGRSDGTIGSRWKMMKGVRGSIIPAKPSYGRRQSGWQLMRQSYLCQDDEWIESSMEYAAKDKRQDNRASYLLFAFSLLHT